VWAWCRERFVDGCRRSLLEATTPTPTCVCSVVILFTFLPKGTTSAARRPWWRRQAPKVRTLRYSKRVSPKAKPDDGPTQVPTSQRTLVRRESDVCMPPLDCATAVHTHSVPHKGLLAAPAPLVPVSSSALRSPRSGRRVRRTARRRRSNVDQEFRTFEPKFVRK